MHTVDICVRGSDARSNYVRAKLKRYSLFCEGSIGALCVLPPNARLTLEDAVSFDTPTFVLAQGADDEAKRVLYSKQGVLVEYNSNERFLEHNAELTASAFLPVLAEKSTRSLFSSCTLVIGYGRIGRALAKELRKLGAIFAVASRSPQNVPDSYVAVNTAHVALSCFDIIVNTAPHRLFEQDRYAEFAPHCTLFELASPPYCLDPTTARNAGINVLVEPALPARYVPDKAGELVLELLKNHFEFVEIGGKL